MRHPVTPRTFENYAHLVQPRRKAGRGLLDAIARCSRCSNRACDSLVTRTTRCADFSPRCTPCSRPTLMAPRTERRSVVPAKAGTSPGVGASLVGALCGSPRPLGEGNARQREGEGCRGVRGVGDLSFRAERSGVEKSLGVPGVGASLVSALYAPPRPLGEGDALQRVGEGCSVGEGCPPVHNRVPGLCSRRLHDRPGSGKELSRWL